MLQAPALIQQMERHINANAAQLALDLWLAEDQPLSRETCLLAGIAHKQLGDNVAAVSALLAALECDPDYPLPAYHLAHIAFNDYNYPVAVEWARRYQAYRPYSTDAFNWIIFALKETGRLSEANEAFAAYAQVFPYSTTSLKAGLLLAESSQNAALGLLMAGRLPLADLHASLFGHSLFACWHKFGQVALTTKTLNFVYEGVSPEADPDFAEGLADLAQLAQQFPSAIERYHNARAVGFSDAVSYLNEALLHWSIGNFHEGNQVYRRRPAALKQLYLDGITEWQGEPLAGKTILVHSEQGCGDVMQFIRYLPALRKQAHAVLFNTYPDILTLLRADESTESVSGLTEAVLDHIDYQICMMDVPGYLHSDGIAGLSPEVPYLFPNKNKVSAWGQRLSPYQGLKIGLVWAGNPIHTNDANRSASLVEWQALGALQGITWFALQKGHGAGESPFPPLGFDVIDLAAEITDFADTAAILANLDLLISVDTSVAHLAGACNFPCWVLLPSEGKDWRWCSQKEIPQWYPSLRLLNRLPAENWDSCIRRALIPKLLELGASLPQEASTPLAHSKLLEQQIAAHLNAGQPALAQQLVLDALVASPNNPRLNWLASKATAALGELTKTQRHLDAVLKVQPRNANAHRMAAQYVARGNLSKAAKHLEMALKVEPNNADTWREAAAFYIENNAPLIALQIMQELLAQEESIENIILLAASLLALGNRDAAMELAQNIDAESISNEYLLSLFHLYASLNWQSKAISLFSRIEAAHPNDSYVGLLLGSSLLRWGDYAKGWPRFDKNNWPEPIEAPLSVPEWRHEDLTDKHLLIYQDQGYGDVIQFYALLWQMPPYQKITLSVFAEIYALLIAQNLPDNIVVITHDELNASPANFDYRVGFMHWVARLAPDLNLPPKTPELLKAPSSRLPEWQHRISTDQQLKIGIVWAGNYLHFNDFNRSTTLQDWLPLSQVANCSWYNLQRDHASNQAFECPQFQFKNIVADCKNLLDTASAIMLLDLVITVDTALAHLSAALGKETWVLLPHAKTDWRWQLDRTDCPWYPTMRLIRRQENETWQHTLANVAEQLASKVATLTTS